MRIKQREGRVHDGGPAQPAIPAPAKSLAKPHFVLVGRDMAGVWGRGAETTACTLWAS